MQARTRAVMLISTTAMAAVAAAVLLPGGSCMTAFIVPSSQPPTPPPPSPPALGPSMRTLQLLATACLGPLSALIGPPAPTALAALDLATVSKLQGNVCLIVSLVCLTPDARWRAASLMEIGRDPTDADPA